MTGQTYLLRSRHGVYYLRMVIPQAVRHALGVPQREVRISLRTKDKQHARLELASRVSAMTKTFKVYLHAIRDHINVKLDEDPEYYKSLSDKLNGIIERHKEHWEELVQLLLEFRDEVDVGPTPPPGISEIQAAFYNILLAEVSNAKGEGVLDENEHNEIVKITKELVEHLEEATSIVDFFKQQSAVDEARRAIRRRLVISSFDQPEIYNAVMDRFMELAKVRFKK